MDKRPTANDPENAAPEAETLPTVELDDVVRKRHPPRGRVLRGIAVLAVCIAAVALVLRALPSSAAPPAPTPASAVPDVVVLLSDVSYGSVSVNGLRVAGAPPLRISLRRGDNTVTLSAPPFQARTCHIFWPQVQVSDGCIADPHYPYTFNGHPVEVVGVTLNLTEADLPADQQAGVIEAIQTALRPVRLHTHVPAGEYFATGNDAAGNVLAQRYSVPLQADASFTANLSWPTFTEAYCVDICPAPLDPDKAPRLREPVWWVTVPVSLGWRFTAPDGSVFTSPTYPSQQPVMLALTYVATGSAGGWQVALDASETLNGFTLPAGLELTVCGAGANLLATLTQARSYNIDSPHGVGREGCLLRLTTQENAPVGEVVWRFGVLLAYGPPGNTLLAALPAAPISEYITVSGLPNG